MAARKSHGLWDLWDSLPTSIELFDKLFDKLPSWAKVIFLVLCGVCFLYSISHYGLGTTFLRVIFSP